MYRNGRRGSARTVRLGSFRLGRCGKVGYGVVRLGEVGQGKAG